MTSELNPRLDAMVLDRLATGSRVICNPPVLDTDEDWLLLVENLPEFTVAAVMGGWAPAFEYHGQSANLEDGLDFMSLRRGRLNLIVTQKPAFFDRFSLATHVATRLNLREKDQRILLFEAFTHGRRL